MNIRLCYASKRITEDHLMEDIVSILATARQFNAEQKIYGVLYYADNAYFQCLEGEQLIVEALFERIKLDQRHHEIKHLGSSIVQKFTFKKWSMKYVEKNSNINDFFKKQGSEQFSPSMLTETNMPDFLNELLLSSQNRTIGKSKVGYTNRGVNRFL